LDLRLSGAADVIAMELLVAMEIQHSSRLPRS